MDFNLLAGQVVDDVITDSIRAFMASGKWPEGLFDKAKAISKEYYELSRAWRDPKFSAKPTRQPITEIYYREAPSETKWDDAFETMQLCLKHFEGSEIRNYLQSFPTSSWRVQDKGSYAPWFMVGDVPVYAKYDFAIVTDQSAVLFDWKTSDPSKKGREDDAVRQLHWYAAYAHSAWEIPYENMRLAPVWLRWGVERPWQEERVNLVIIEELQALWRGRHSLIVEKLKAASSGSSVDDEFPFTSDQNRCRYCTFRVCERHPIGMPRV